MGIDKVIHWLLNRYQHSLVPVIQSYASISPSHIKMAILKKKKKLALWLLKRLPESSFEPRNDSLALACEKEFDNDFCKALLKKGAPINARTDQGMTALLIAVQQQNLARIQFLLQEGADSKLAVLTTGITLSPHEGRTAFHLAVISGNKEIITYFERQGLASNQADFYGQTPYTSPNEAKPSLAQGCQYRKQCCVIVITGHIKDEWVVIAGRKKNILGKAEGYYVLPGGFKDPEDDSYAMAALREIKEETGLHFEIEDLKELYRLEHREEETWVETVYFHIHWKNNFTLPQLRPGSDLAEICCIPWRQVKKKQFSSGYLGFFYEQHRIRQSNAMLIDALAEEKLDQFNFNRWREMQAIENFNSPEILQQKTNAFKNEDLAFFRNLYDQGTELCQTNLLHLACHYNKTKLIPLLIEYCDTSINLLCRTPQMTYTALPYYTPLMMAITNKHIQQAKELIEKYNANIEIAQSGISALTLACVIGSDELVNYFICHRPTVLSQGMGGVALLHTMSIAESVLPDNSMRCFELLLAGHPQQPKIELNKRYNYNTIPHYPLSFAIRYNRTSCVQQLLAAGAVIDLCLEELNEVAEKISRIPKDRECSMSLLELGLFSILNEKIDDKLVRLLIGACAKSSSLEIKKIGAELDKIQQKLIEPQEDLGLALLFKQ